MLRRTSLLIMAVAPGRLLGSPAAAWGWNGTSSLSLPECPERCRIAAATFFAPTNPPGSPRVPDRDRDNDRQSCRPGATVDSFPFREGREHATHGRKGENHMADELAAANVNRSYQLAASSIAIFTFLLFFLYPRFASGEVDALRYQATLIVMGVATFSFAFASFYYYGASLGGRIDDAERTQYSLRGDRFWLLGTVLLFL